MILSSYYKNIFSTILLVILTALATVYMSISIGQLRYITEAQNIYNSSSISDDVYIMLDDPNLEMTYIELRNEIKNIEKINGVKEVVSITQGNIYIGQDNTTEKEFSYSEVDNKINHYANSVSYLACDDEIINGMNLKVTEGSWFDKANNVPDDAIAVVVANDKSNTYKVGQTVQEYLLMGNIRGGINDKEHPLHFERRKFYIIGILDSNSYLPEFTTSGSYMRADNILTNFKYLNHNKPNEIYFIAYNDEKFNKIIIEPSYTVPRCYPNMLIDFDDDISKDEKQKCIDILREYGMVLTDDDIKKSTEDYVSIQMKKKLPMPFFIFIISTVAFFSLSVLFVYKKLNETTIYQMVGAKKGRVLFDISFSLFLITLPSIIISFIALANIDSFLLFLGPAFSMYNMLVDSYSYLLIVIYLTVMLAISIILPLVISGRKTVLEMYRRKE